MLRIISPVTISGVCIDLWGATRTPARFGLRMMCVDLPVKARSRTSLSCAEFMLMFLHT